MKLRSLAGYAAMLLGGTFAHAQDVTLGRPIVRGARPDYTPAATSTTIPYGVSQTVLLDPTTVQETYPLKSSRLIVVQRPPAPAPIIPPPLPGTEAPRSGYSTGIRPVAGGDVVGGDLQALPMPNPGNTGNNFAPAPKMVPMPNGGQPHGGRVINTMPADAGSPQIIYEGGGNGQVWDGGNGCGCNFGCGCCPTPRMWGSIEYLLWFSKSASTPPLLTTSPPGTPFFQSGILGDPGTQVLEGGTGLNVGGTSGMRATVGGWFAHSPDVLGFEASGFVLEKNSNITTVASDTLGNPILARPFFDTILNQEAALVVAHPGPLAFLLPGQQIGSYHQTLSQHIFGFEGNLVYNIGELAYSKNYLLVGFRYFDFHEKLTIATSSYDPQIDAGTQVVDVFNDRTQFYGAQIGLRKNFDLTPHFSVDLTGKLALGAADHTAGANGYTQAFNAGGAFFQQAGGLYAVSTNSGRQTKTNFAYMPEVDLKINYKVTQNFSVFVGGNFLYMSSVMRPGDQIDRRVDQRNVPSSGLFGAPGATGFPAPQLRDSDFWLTGLTAGFTLRY